MGWKNVKDHYRIVHQVQVTEAGICIGSPYIHDLIVISLAGEITKENDRTLNDELHRYQQEMKADPDKLRELVMSADTFERSIPVFTYDGAEIIEKQCEALDWPNVTHDGLMMYENTFSADRDKVIAWAKSNCLASIKYRRERIADIEDHLAAEHQKLSMHLANAATLGIEPPPAPQPNVAADDESLWRFWNEKAQQLAGENDRLRKALQPFAKFSSIMSATQQHRMFLQLLVCPVGDEHPDDYGRHIEVARAALATTEGK